VTEFDKAYFYARSTIPDGWHEDDCDIEGRVNAYRAGQAASAARIKALEGALKPFARTGAVLDSKPNDDACWAGQRPAPPITFGHLRRAAHALLKETEQ